MTSFFPKTSQAWQKLTHFPQIIPPPPPPTPQKKYKNNNNNEPWADQMLSVSAQMPSCHTKNSGKRAE